MWWDLDWVNKHSKKIKNKNCTTQKQQIKPCTQPHTQTKLNTITRVGCKTWVQQKAQASFKCRACTRQIPTLSLVFSDSLVLRTSWDVSKNLQGRAADMRLPRLRALLLRHSHFLTKFSVLQKYLLWHMRTIYTEEHDEQWYTAGNVGGGTAASWTT